MPVFFKQLRLTFAIMAVAGVGLLLFNWYQNHLFDSHPIPPHIQHQVDIKEQEIIALIQQRFGIAFQVPVTISNQIPSHLYGATIYGKDHSIAIVLNKKRFKENREYMIEDVLPHEYAHAVMFKMGWNAGPNGHNEQWQSVCEKLNGRNCRRFVDHNDILREKVLF